MNKELETLINNLESCIGVFDYMLTPIENNLLLSYINELQQENEKLKQQYCERTDCVGRLGNSRKVERLIQENKELHNKIDKAIEYIEENTQELEGITGYYYTIYDTEDLLEILKDSDVDE